MDLTNLTRDDIIPIIGVLILLYLFTVWYIRDYVSDKIDATIKKNKQLEKYDGLLSEEQNIDTKRTYDGTSIRDLLESDEDPDGAKSELTELYDFSSTGKIDEGNYTEKNRRKVVTHNAIDDKEKCIKDMLQLNGCYECSAQVCGIYKKKIDG